MGRGHPGMPGPPGIPGKTLTLPRGSSVPQLWDSGPEDTQVSALGSCWMGSGWERDS